MRNQFLIFLFYFLLNFLSTLTVLKIYSKRGKEIDINRILNSACEMAILLVNCLFISIIITGSLDYFIYRYFGDILMETRSIFNIGLLMIIFAGLIVFFIKCPILQKEFGYKTKGLFFLATIGLILLLSIMVIDIVSPHPDIHLADFPLIIIINLIIIFMNILILYKPLTLKQAKPSEEHVFSNKEAL